MIHGDSLIVNWIIRGIFLTVLDPRTARNAGKSTASRSPVGPLRLVEYEGRTHLIVNGTKRVRSYDLKTGEVIWEVRRASGGRHSLPRGLRRTRLLHDRLSRQHPVRDSAQCERGHYRHRSGRLAQESRNAVRSFSAAVWRPAVLHRLERRDPVLPGREDRRTRLRAAAIARDEEHLRLAGRQPRIVFTSPAGTALS